MAYLFLQIWVWLLLAFVLGWVAHWFLNNRSNKQDDERPNIDDGTPTATGSEQSSEDSN